VAALVALVANFCVVFHMLNLKPGKICPQNWGFNGFE